MDTLEPEFEYKTMYGEQIGVRKKQEPIQEKIPEEIPFEYIKNPVVAEKERKKTKFNNFNFGISSQPSNFRATVLE